MRSDGRIGPGKTTLKRGEEIREDDSIALFSTTLEDIQGLYLDMAERQKHVLSVLEDALKSARLQKNRQALLLAGFLIYYLKQGGYKVSPYVRRLKDAERVVQENKPHA